MNASVEAARKVNVPAEAIIAIRAIFADYHGDPDARRSSLAAIRKQYGNTVYELAKFRAIANA